MKLLDILTSCADSFEESVCIIDINQEEYPIIYVNSKFTQLTQYSKKEAKGRNCLFMQGEDTDLDVCENTKECMDGRCCVFHDVLNYKKDGTSFWNRLILFPIERGDEAYYLGVHNDITHLVVAHLESCSVTHDLLEDDIGDNIINPLTMILGGYSRYVSKTLSEEDKDQYVKEINQGLARVCDYLIFRLMQKQAA